MITGECQKHMDKNPHIKGDYNLPDCWLHCLSFFTSVVTFIPLVVYALTRKADVPINAVVFGVLLTFGIGASANDKTEENSNSFEQPVQPVGLTEEADTIGNFFETQPVGLTEEADKIENHFEI